MRNSCWVVVILILCIALAISCAGAGENPNVQIVTLKNVGMSMSLNSAIAGNANSMKYLGYIIVENKKGEEMRIDWPEKSFFDMTGGTVTGGMKLQIEKNKNTNKWEVVKIMGESNSK